MKQINHLTTKLNQAIGILNTLRNNTSLKTQKMTYHSLFSSHLLYGSQLWGHTNLTNQNKIQKLQNRALRKILLKKRFYEAILQRITNLKIHLLFIKYSYFLKYSYCCYWYYSYYRHTICMYICACNAYVYIWVHVHTKTRSLLIFVTITAQSQTCLIIMKFCIMTLMCFF